MTQTMRPIQSAESVALLRAACHRESDPAVRNPDQFAKHFIGKGFYRFLLALPRPISRFVIENLSPGSYCSLLIRTRFMDEHLLRALQQGIRQVVILGAGYDSRAWRFAEQLKGTRVFEVDLPGTQAAKLACLKKAGMSTPSNLQFFAHDFNNGDLIARLQQQGLDTSLPTFFLWEGVCYYLPQAAVVANLQTVVGACAPGSILVLDYALRSFVEGDSSTYGGEAVQKWLKKINEPFLFGLNADETTTFMTRCGMQMIDDIGPAQMSERYLQGRNGLLGNPLGHLRLAAVSWRGQTAIAS